MTGKASKNLRKALAEMQSKEIRIGWFEGNKYPDGLPVAQVAYWMEYGATRRIKQGSNSSVTNIAIIPPRAPLRTAAETQEKNISPTMRMLVQRGMETGKVDEGLNQIGALAASHVKDVFSSNLPPPNAESTVNGMVLRKGKDGKEVRAGSSPEKGNRKFGQGKGFSRTLIDTGQMMKTVTWKVEDADSGK